VKPRSATQAETAGEQDNWMPRRRARAQSSVSSFAAIARASAGVSSRNRMRSLMRARNSGANWLSSARPVICSSVAWPRPSMRAEAAPKPS
jgi:hypothetical protein